MVPVWQKERINSEKLQRLSLTDSKEEMQRMDYINAFWGGRPDLCFGADINGKNEDDAGTHHGAFSGYRCGDQCPWLV